MDRKAATEVKTEVEVEVETEGKVEVPSEVGGGNVEPKQRPVEKKAGLTVPIRNNVQMQEIKEMKFGQEGFEAVVKAELGGIKELLQKALEKLKKAPAAAVTVPAHEYIWRKKGVLRGKSPLRGGFESHPPHQVLSQLRGG
jgi:hypothetical protein